MNTNGTRMHPGSMVFNFGKCRRMFLLLFLYFFENTVSNLKLYYGDAYMFTYAYAYI